MSNNSYFIRKEKDCFEVITHWIRDFESTRSKKSLNHWIKDLSDLVTTYAKTILFFDSVNINKKALTLEDNVVTHTGYSSYHSVFVKGQISSGQHHYKFKVHNYNIWGSWCLAFGILPISQVQKRINEYMCGYGFQSAVARMDPSAWGRSLSRVADELKNGDIIDVYLSFEDNKMLLFINDEFVIDCITPDTIKKDTYRFGVSSWYQGNKWEALSYDGSKYTDDKKHRKMKKNKYPGTKTSSSSEEWSE